MRDGDRLADATTNVGHPRDAPGALHERILQKSAAFARSAISAYTDKNWDVFHLHLATAIELLAKATLAGTNPALIADPKSDLDSLLHLIGLSAKSKSSGEVVRTIGASAAFERVARVLDDSLRPPTALQLLLNLRNNVVHLGDHEARDEALLGDVAAYAERLLEWQAADSDRYWGESATLVAELVETRHRVLSDALHRRIAAAQALYTERFAHLDPEAKEIAIRQLTEVEVAPPFQKWPAECPACEEIGTASGEPDADWEADWDHDGGEPYVVGAYVGSIDLVVDSFDCRVCELALARPLLRHANLEHLSYGGDDFDVGEATQFFVRRAEDDWSYEI